MKDRSTVICARDANILLVARSPARWSLPGGNIKLDESPLAAALRELEEEIAVGGLPLSYLFFFEGINKRRHVFFAELPRNAHPRPSNEISLCRWVRPTRITTLRTSVPTREIVSLVMECRDRSGNASAEKRPHSGSTGCALSVLLRETDEPRSSIRNIAPLMESDSSAPSGSEDKPTREEDPDENSGPGGPQPPTDDPAVPAEPPHTSDG